MIFLQLSSSFFLTCQDKIKADLFNVAIMILWHIQTLMKMKSLSLNDNMKNWHYAVQAQLHYAFCVRVYHCKSIQQIIPLYCGVLRGHRSVIGCHNDRRHWGIITPSLSAWKAWIHFTRSNTHRAPRQHWWDLREGGGEHYWCLILCESNVIILFFMQVEYEDISVTLGANVTWCFVRI